jgi:hypothetical protein
VDQQHLSFQNGPELYEADHVWSPIPFVLWWKNWRHQYLGVLRSMINSMRKWNMSDCWGRIIFQIVDWISGHVICCCKIYCIPSSQVNICTDILQQDNMSGLVHRLSQDMLAKHHSLSMYRHKFSLICARTKSTTLVALIFMIYTCVLYSLMGRPLL